MVKGTKTMALKNSTGEQLQIKDAHGKTVTIAQHSYEIFEPAKAENYGTVYWKSKMGNIKK